MSAVGPGDWVVCVDDRPRPDGEPSRVTKGEHYTVLLAFNTFEGPGLLLNEVDPSPHAGWHTHRFRRVYRPKQELIDSLLKPERVSA